jgi:hypothetical protein
MSKPTEEEIKKFANEIRAAKQKGFIAQLVGLGKSAAEVRQLHQTYVKLDAQREHKFEQARQAILGA